MPTNELTVDSRRLQLQLLRPEKMLKPFIRFLDTIILRYVPRSQIGLPFEAMNYC